MTIANTFAAKLSVAFVAVAMALSMVAPAQAQTAEELQAQIDALMATIASLQGQTTVTASGSAYVFTRSLTIGSEGADVTALQTYLISGGYSIPAGATGYFGAQTQAAVAAWQTANGVMPAAGYFGPVSQAKYNALMAAVTPTPDEDEDEDEDEDDTDSDELQGEASLDVVEMADGEDDEVEEGQEAAPVAEITVEFANGDAEISRIDIGLEVAAGNDGDDNPWDVFEEVSLWVDGDEVATVDASDEDEYLDEDFGSLRFSDLDIRANEDEEVVITVAVTVQGSVDGVANGETWNVAVGEIRFVDADDVTTTEDNVGDQQDLDGTYTAENAQFVIEEEGAGDELDLKASADEPDEQTLQLSASDSEEFEIFAFELDADDSDGDIELDSITVDIAISSTSGAIDDLVNDFRIEIDGESFDAESYTGTGDTAAVEFDIDGDVTIAAGETATVVVFADFDEMESDSLYQGDTITASVDTTDIVAEGAEDITVGGSNQTGEPQTLRSEGIIIGTDVETTTDTQGTNDDTGIFSIEFEVTALEGDFYINDLASTTATAVTGGVEFRIDGPAAPTTATGVLASTADDDTNAFFIPEGETETFTLTVTVNGSVAGQHRLVLEEVWFSEDDDGENGLVEVPTPESTYRTDYENIN